MRVLPDGAGEQLVTVLNPRYGHPVTTPILGDLISTVVHQLSYVSARIVP